MRTTLSAAGLASINAQETSEVWLPLVVLDHEDFADPVRLVANIEAVTHSGDVFTPYPFTIALPDETDDLGAAVVRWVADNVSLEILDELRAVSGPIQGSVFWVLASDPDHIEIGPFDLELRGFKYNDMTISGQMTIEPILDAVFGALSMDPKNAPGLF